MGGNIGDVPRAFIWAIDALNSRNTRVTAVSSLYVTEPLLPAGGKTPTSPGHVLPHYFNAACRLRTRLGPHQLLRCLQKLEQRAGRDRRERWGPRTLDLDLLAYAQVTLTGATLTLPHPAWRHRAFVVHPLADLGVQSLDGAEPSCADLLAQWGLESRTQIWDRRLSWRGY